MKSLNKAVDGILLVLMNIVIWVMCGSVVLQVVTRYALRAPLPWTEEVARICMVWMTFLGASYLLGARKNGHIVVDALLTVLPEKVRSFFQAFAHVCVVILSVLLIICGIKLMMSSVDLRLTATRMPTNYLYASAPVSAVFMIFYELRSLYERFTEVAV